MYENMTPRQRIKAYVVLMLPAIRRAAAEGRLPALKPAERDGGGRAAESTADTSRASA